MSPNGKNKKTNKKQKKNIPNKIDIIWVNI